MAECNTCGGYLSMEDKIRLSMKCDANGNVVWQGALLNPEPDTEVPDGVYLVTNDGDFMAEAGNDNNLFIEIT